MGQLSVVNGVRYIRVLAAFVFVATVAANMPRLAHAENTKVVGQMCTPFVSAASMQVTSPVPGTIVDTLPVLFQGNVTQISQINIDLNGQYHATVPIASGHSTFTANINLPKGTSTLKLKGTDVCHVTDPEVTMTITYEPIENNVPGTPSNPDQSSGLNPSTGEQNAPGPSSPAPAPKLPNGVGGEGVRTVGIPFQNVPLIGPVTKLAYDLAVNFDFDNRNKNAWQLSVLRFIFFAAGAFLLVGLPLIMLLIQSRNQAAAVTYVAVGDELRRTRRRRMFVIAARIIGIILIIVTFFI